MRWHIHGWRYLGLLGLRRQCRRCHIVQSYLYLAGTGLGRARGQGGAWCQE